LGWIDVEKEKVWQELVKREKGKKEKLSS